MARRHLVALPRRVRRALVARARAAPAVLAICARAAAKILLRRTGRPDVILHAGQHKTGTTTIQAVTMRRRADLAERGIHVLWSGQGIDGAHHSLIYRLTGQPSRRLSLRLLRIEMAQAFPRQVLISSEAAKEAVVGGRGARLIDALRAAGARRIRLLLYLRSPFALANAAFFEEISSLRGGGATFGEYLRARDKGCAHRYDRFLDLARREDVELVVRPYGEAARRSILSDFAAAIGVPLAASDEPRLNSSYGPVGLEAMRIIALETGPMPLEVQWRLRDRLREIARALGEDPFWGMDEAHERLLGQAERSTDEFARAVWGRGWRDAIGEEKRPRNVFDPQDVRQQDLFRETLARMRAVQAEELAEPASR
jgi:hypothetical protein